ncbi:membrane-bound metal-dependent hydrolase [Halalkaliarchaeum desulfuricum]|uniref:Membrane-bound metal-dependent hydrolase n=1 Tax=Halalkaliarchaeum desulfuricum TaxID=2055893 RepID=A0A343TNF1_9EURY|nr:metal-dependent hydrolase [Halalkaliarchaeum desulfuricum]AUX10623.1 membrane-bound metal-dependent hydrolase [Halalkaliarchaeum desulfuricum]
MGTTENFIRGPAENESTVYQLGHYGIALLCYAPVARLFVGAGEPHAALAGGLLVAGAAVLPDCDVYLPLSHRGLTHTLWFVVGVGVAVAVAVVTVATQSTATGVRPFWGPVAGLLAAGAVLSHVAVDAATPMGIRPFAPLSDWHVTLDLVASKHRTANVSLFLIGGAAVAIATMV